MSEQQQQQQQPNTAQQDLFSLADVKFGPDGLVPVVVQDVQTGAVLMQAYADLPALEHALSTRQGTYFSRSRQQQWIKGQSSGHLQHIETVRLDCDGDSVLYQVQQLGPGLPYRRVQLLSPTSAR